LHCARFVSAYCTQPKISSFCSALSSPKASILSISPITK
jgi:hypothetical protein